MECPLLFQHLTIINGRDSVKDYNNVHVITCIYYSHTVKAGSQYNATQCVPLGHLHVDACSNAMQR